MPDRWKTIHQQMPVQVYDRWVKQLRRVARVNGISVESFENDSKFGNQMGPRVMTFENLVILMERSDDEALRV